MKITTRILAMLLALIMALGVLAMTACADTSEDPEESQEGTQPGDETPAPEEEQEERLPLDYLPTTRYDGTEIHILEWSANGQEEVGRGWIPWEEIDVDEGDGDPINNAIYDRNGYVEELYGVEITKEYLSVDGSPAYATAFRSNESSGDQAYQMITMRTVGIAGFAMENLMANMYDMPNLHTDMPWWSQDSVRSYTMGDALFFAAPEMLLRDKGATAVMYFNQKIAEDQGIEDLYEIAKEGGWTMDLMIELAEGVAADMDGDDLVSSAEDMFGLDGGGRDIPYFLFTGSGNKFAVIDDDGYLELTFGDEETITVWQDILDYVMYSDFYSMNVGDPSRVPEGFNVFRDDRCLFQMNLVKDVLGLRNMESDYGVLPIPKYDETQENYSSLVWMHHDCVLGIPGSCTNTEIISTVLEHMSYISYYDIYPIFYDTIILGKSARDQQSKEMLELVFQTRAFDPGQYWLAESTGPFLVLFEQKKTNIASVWASAVNRVESELEDFNEKIDELQ